MQRIRNVILFFIVFKFLFNFYLMSQNWSLNWVEIEPRWMDTVEICKIIIPQDLKECIRFIMANTKCPITKKDSSEIFKVYVDLSIRGENKIVYIDNTKGYDACLERCTLYLELTDLIFIDWDIDNKLRWDYGGYFDIDGDTFFVIGGKRKYHEGNYCYSKYFEKSRYFQYTNECIKKEIPILRSMYYVDEKGNEILDKNFLQAKYLKKDYRYHCDKWPFIKIIVVGGKVVCCEYLCDFHKDKNFILYGNKIKKKNEK